MPNPRPPSRDFVRVMTDSRRWSAFEPRPDDIVITTPPKSGTTWMQGIVSSLLWPSGDAPGSLHDRSLWLEWPLVPLEAMHAELEAMEHRRFLKTHTPADAMPIHEQCRYIAVYRDGRDALMSWANHRRNLRPQAIALLNEAAEDGVPRLAPDWTGDLDELFDQWVVDCSPVEHLASWWPLRSEPNTLFVHFADLTADLSGEMRRVADFLDIEVVESDWQAVVDRCRLAAMRTDAADDGLEMVFEGGADAFYNKGTGGRWRGVLSGEHLARWDRMVAEGLPDEAARWLEHGSLALGHRP